MVPPIHAHLLYTRLFCQLSLRKTGKQRQKAFVDAVAVKWLAGRFFTARTIFWELQALADETGLPIKVSHFPPGTSKWNKVEHRLFSCISQNWRGEPVTSYETIVKLIASTTTRTGLKVHCQLDGGKYPLKRKVSNKEMKTINLIPGKFHGEWNYTIEPRNNR